MVFTLPAPISAIAYTNKELIYGLLFDIAAETLRTIAADPKHLGARIGTDPGAAYLGLGADASSARARHRTRRRASRPTPIAGCRASRGSSSRCESCRACFGAASSKNSQNAHRDGQLKFFGEHVDLADADAFADWLTPLRQCEWVVYAKRPFSGPEQVLAYLSRYTHRVAISNSRLVALDDRGVTFRWKDYRAQGRTRYKTMTLPPRSSCAASCCTCCPPAFIASATMDCSPTPTARTTSPPLENYCINRHPSLPLHPTDHDAGHGSARPTFVCRHCGAPMIVIETFARAQHYPRTPVLTVT